MTPRGAAITLGPVGGGLRTAGQDPGRSRWGYMLDLLIKGGLIVDGGGSPGYYGVVGVEGDRITILRGDVSDVPAERVLDATGRVVCPGFIDVHAHSGLMILADPRHEPKVHQGITTELIGIDGNSYAPFKSNDDLRRFIELNSGLDGDPELPGT